MRKTLVSIVILTCLGFQALVVLGPQPSYEGGFFWPFTDYPMYDRARYEGGVNNRYFLFGETTPSEVKQLYPRDFGLSAWIFSRGPVAALLKDDEKKTLFFADLYQKRHGEKLVSLRLEQHSWEIRRDGPHSLPSQKVREVEL